MPSTPPSSLQRLPYPSPASKVAIPELLNRVLRHADDSTLAASMRVSKQVFELASRHLYETLDWDLTAGKDPFFGQGVPAKTRTTRRGPPVLSYKDAVLVHTRFLILHPHASECRLYDGRNLRLPNLKVLTAWIPVTGGHPSPFCRNVYCSLMSIPRRSATVVVRWEHPLPNDFIHPEPRLWFRFKPRKIVLPITSIGRRGDLDFGWRILDYASEHSHFTLVLLFCVPPGQVCQAGGPRPDVCDDRSRVLFEWFEHNFFRITQFLEADLMVCNAGSIDPECVPLDPESDRRTVQNAVEAKVRKDCPSPESLGNFTPEQIKKIPGRIRFVSMEEYLEENDWEGELKEAEVRPWLDLMAAEKAGLASGAIGHRGQASKVGEGSRVEEI